MNRRVPTWIAALFLMVPAPARAHFHQMPSGPPQPIDPAVAQAVFWSGLVGVVAVAAITTLRARRRVRSRRATVQE